MPSIEILEQKETKSGWELGVKVDDSDFTVVIDREYWQKLTGGREEVGELVRRSFEFLLKNEPLMPSVLRISSLLLMHDSSKCFIFLNQGF